MKAKTGTSAASSLSAPGTGALLGTVVQVTDQHIHQRLPGGRVVMHDIARFRPDPAIGPIRDALKPDLAGPLVVVSYEGDTARLQRVRIDDAAKAQIHRDVQQWADRHFTDPAARQRFEVSLRKAIEDLVEPHAKPPVLRTFERSLVHESMETVRSGRPGDRIAERHDRFAASLAGETAQRAAPRLSTPAAQRWASLDAADLARMSSEPDSERERQRALAVIRRGPAEYQVALSRLQVVQVVPPTPAATQRGLSDAPGIHRDRGLER